MVLGFISGIIRLPVSKFGHLSALFVHAPKHLGITQLIQNRCIDRVAVIKVYMGYFFLGDPTSEGSVLAL